MSLWIDPTVLQFVCIAVGVWQAVRWFLSTVPRRSVDAGND